MIAIDSTFFPYLFNHPTNIPQDPATQKPVENIRERIDLLIETLQEERETILIPTPALSEFLVLADRDGAKYLKELTSNPLYVIKDFDIRAAVELASIRLDMQKKMTKAQIKAQSPESTYAKIAFDRQIVAIAKAHGAHTIYSEDGGVGIFAKQVGLAVVQVWALSKPRGTQMPLAFFEVAPNVIQLPARTASKEDNRDEQGNGKEASEEEYVKIEPSSDGADGVSKLPATSPTLSLSAKSGDSTDEVNPPIEV